MPLMAIGNRLRGSDGEGWLWEHRWPVSFIGTLFSSVLLASFFGICWQALLVIAAYFFGEAAPGPNWGVACGAISNHTPGYKKQYPLLAIRGGIWWFGVLFVFWFWNKISFLSALFALIALSIGFPLCMDLGRLPRFNFPYLRSAWEWGEFIYGGVVGAVFVLIL